MWEMCPLPHPHMMVTISSKRLLRETTQGQTPLQWLRVKGARDLRRIQKQKTEALISKLIAWLHASLMAEAAGFCILHGMYQIGLCIPHSRSLLPHHTQQPTVSKWTHLPGKPHLLLILLGLTGAQALYPLGLCGHWEARRPVSGVVSSLLPAIPHIPEGAHLRCSRGCRPGVAQDPGNFCAFTTTSEGPAVMFFRLLSNGGRSRTWRKLKH